MSCIIIDKYTDKYKRIILGRRDRLECWKEIMCKVKIEIRLRVVYIVKRSKKVELLYYQPTT